MKSLSTLASNVRASTTMAIDAMSKKMKAEGIDVIGFGAGEPDFATPDRIKEACIRAIHDNQTKYTPASGIIQLKEAACRRMEEDCGVSYGPENTVVASGAKHIVYLAMRALLNPGDEVILPAPFWVSYSEIVAMCGGVPVVVTTREEDDFQLSPAQLEAAITDRTKGIILNSPNNPTGMLYDEAELRAIGDVCVKHDLYVISDEIYYKLVYGEKQFTSFPALGDRYRERTILVNGVSKSYSMTGWRIGYAMAPVNIAKIMSSYVSHSTAAPATFAQWGAVEALSGPQGETEAMRRAFQERRDYMVERISQIPGVSCRKPEGAFYVLMNISKVLGKTLYGKQVETSDDFAALLLEKGLVAVVPGSGFAAPDYVRWSYATSLEHIREGMDRLERFLQEG